MTSALPTHLRLVVPATAANGPITVITPSGSATSTQSFRVLGPLTVTPTAASVAAGTSLQFSAAGSGGATPAVDWAVNDIRGGDASVGTISASGLYTAPASASQPSLVTISATDQADPSSKGSTVAMLLAAGAHRSSLARAVSVGLGRGPNLVSSVPASSVSASLGGRDIKNSVQASVSTATFGGMQVSNSLESRVSAVVGGHPSSMTSTRMSVSVSSVITGVSPGAGSRGATGLAVTITGAGFADATQVTFLLNNVADTMITSSIISVNPDGTEATLDLSIASGAATGVRVVRITAPAGISTILGTGANLFTVQ